MSQDIEYEKNELEEAINRVRQKYLKEMYRQNGGGNCCKFKNKQKKILKR